MKWLWLLATWWAFVASTDVDSKPNRTYPLIAATYRELPTTVRDFSLLRRDHVGEAVPRASIQLVLDDMLTICPSNAYVLVDIPGLKVADFVTLRPASGIKLWDHLRSTLSAAGTAGTFASVDGRIDLNRLERKIRADCGTQDLEVRMNRDPIVEPYGDIKPRLATLRFSRLPQDELARDVELRQIGQQLEQVFKALPTPFFSLVLTSSTGELAKPGLRDIFPDIIRLQKDPRNRKQWQQHDEIKPGERQLPDRKLSLVEQKRQDERKKLKEKQRESSETVLSTETVMVLTLTMIMGVMVWVVFGFVRGLMHHGLKD